jgi:uncharacterized protein (DUF362 family)
MKKLSRRQFLATASLLGAGALGLALYMKTKSGGQSLPVFTKSPGSTSPPWTTPPPPPVVSLPPRVPPSITTPPQQPYMAVARGPNPEKITRAAIDAIGGMRRFVKPGNDVIVKPNICVAYRTPEYASTTNPEVVGAVVTMALKAGAKRVRVMDFGWGGTMEEAYKKSGIRDAVEKAGGEMEIMAQMKYVKVDIPKGRDLTRCTVYRDVMETDVLINVATPKEHGISKLTIGMKNLMGVVQGRNAFHSNIHQRVADLTSLVYPTLTILDAVRIQRNGPDSGSLSDVTRLDTVIATHDIVAADAYGATLFGKKGEDIGFIKAGYDMGLGEMDLKKIDIKEIQV